MSQNPKNNDTPTPPTPPARSLEEIMAEVKASVALKAAAREAKKAELNQVRAEPKWHIVAWVDLLGFREQVRRADTPEKFQAVYRRMREVHEEFQKDTATIEPDQAELNAGMGKTIVALSDGLVIALNLEDDVPVAGVSSLYERIGSFLESLRLAQARCASVGNLVRGGVALGYFWFQDDIMLSPALVEAYELETTLACNPVIILKRELAEGVRNLVEGEGWEKGYDPLADLFRNCDWMDETARSEHVMLNFMPMFNEDEDPQPFLKSYHKHLIEGRAAAFVAAELPSLEETIFGSSPTGGVGLDGTGNRENISPEN